MSIYRHTALVISSLLALAACSTDEIGPSDLQAVDANAESLERRLGLIPQTMNSADLPEAGRILKGTISRYVVLSAEAGAIDVDSIAVSNEEGAARSLAELFPVAPPAQTGRIERDALLLTSVSQDDVQELCERFLLAHDSADLVTVDNQQLLFVAPAAEGRKHALCLLPANDKGDGEETSNKTSATGGTQNIGSGSYTVHVYSLKCNDPRDWQNGLFNGDEARMRAFRDGSDLGQIWSANNVQTSSDTYYPKRFVHFNSNAKLELYDYDSGLWNPSDKLGSVSIYSGEACDGVHSDNFDGNGSGHDWDYDLKYKVYGPACPCQTMEPQILKSYDSESCSVTSSTIKSYTYYCSGGIYYRQAWGDVTRHCKTTRKTYNESCELKTLYSSLLMSECDKYAYGVVIGSAVQVGTCESAPDPCNPVDPIEYGNPSTPQSQLILPPECSLGGSSEM